MEYKIKIEGGFRGLPEVYIGETDLSPQEQEELIAALQNPPEKNHNVRDGFSYLISFITDNGLHTNTYDDTNMPAQLRKFIQKVKDSQNSP
ncbi:protealysin inhibitor emfourin [Maribacter sp. 2210JD10-5]|uniref:protealysin inhibitor emfourin n=1 Tax=Maribacter sp. 2210JD10-5 TaxID=3386272 RepID=UPI0039BD3180